MFDNYTILDEKEENKFLLDCLASYFDPLKGIQYKSPQNYQKYCEWKTTTHNPSSKTIYNFIRKHTTLVSEEKVIFTLTKTKGVFYRISTEYEKVIRKFQQKRTKITSDKTTNSKDNDANTTVTNDHIIQETNAPHQPPTPNEQNPPDVSPSIPKLVQNLDTKLTQEITDINNVKTTSPLDMDTIIKEKMLSLLPQIKDTLLTSITKEIDKHTEICITKLNETAAEISRTTFNLDIEQESYKRATDKIKNRIFFIDKQLEESSKRIDKHETLISKQKEEFTTRKCEELFDKMDTTLTKAENDIYATVQSIQTTHTNATTEINNHLQTFKDAHTNAAFDTITKVDNNTNTIRQIERHIASLTDRIDDVHTDALTHITTQISNVTNETKYSQEALREEMNLKINAIKNERNLQNTAPANTSTNNAHSTRSNNEYNSTDTDEDSYRHRHRTNYRHRRRRDYRSNRERNKNNEMFVTPTKDQADNAPTYDETYHGSTYWKKNQTNDRAQSYEAPSPTYDNTYQKNTYTQSPINNSQPYRTNNTTIDTNYLRKNVKISCTDDTVKINREMYDNLLL